MATMVKQSMYDLVLEHWDDEFGTGWVTIQKTLTDKGARFLPRLQLGGQFGRVYVEPDADRFAPYRRPNTWHEVAFHAAAASEGIRVKKIR